MGNETIIRFIINIAFFTKKLCFIYTNEKTKCYQHSQLHDNDNSGLHIVYISKFNEVIMVELFHNFDLPEDINSFCLGNLDELCCINTIILFADDFMNNSKSSSKTNKIINVIFVNFVTCRTPPQFIVYLAWHSLHSS